MCIRDRSKEDGDDDGDDDDDGDGDDGDDGDAYGDERSLLISDELSSVNQTPKQLDTTDDDALSYTESIKYLADDKNVEGEEEEDDEDEEANESDNEATDDYRFSSRERDSVLVSSDEDDGKASINSDSDDGSLKASRSGYLSKMIDDDESSDHDDEEKSTLDHNNAEDSENVNSKDSGVESTKNVNSDEEDSADEDKDLEESSTRAVSYTHLDVYKRQVIEKIIRRTGSRYISRTLHSKLLLHLQAGWMARRTVTGVLLRALVPPLSQQSH